MQESKSEIDWSKLHRDLCSSILLTSSSMWTGDRTVLETVVNVATSMPFVLVGLQTPRSVILSILQSREHGAPFTQDACSWDALVQHELRCRKCLEAKWSHVWSLDLILVAGRSLQVECMETQSLELGLRQACTTRLVVISERSSASVTTPWSPLRVWYTLLTHESLRTTQSINMEDTNTQITHAFHKFISIRITMYHPTAHPIMSSDSNCRFKLPTAHLLEHSFSFLLLFLLLHMVTTRTWEGVQCLCQTVLKWSNVGGLAF